MGFHVSRADAVASRGPTRPQLAATRARRTEKYIHYAYQNFKNRVLENRENGYNAEFNSGLYPFVRILIPATQFERRIFFKMFLTSDILRCPIQYAVLESLVYSVLTLAERFRG